LQPLARMLTDGSGVNESYGPALERLRLLLDAVDRHQFLEQETSWVPEKWSLTEGFQYKGRGKRRRQRELLDGLASRRVFVQSLAQTSLTRSTVRQIVDDAGEDGERLVDAFIAVMAWGFPSRGLGPYRTSVMLSPAEGSPKPVDVLPQVVQELRDFGSLAGYQALMNQLEGCGPAFGTKFLYFASRDGDRAPILDDLVARWMAGRGVLGGDGLSIRSRGWNTKDYKGYLAFLDTASVDLDEPDVGLMEYVMFVDQQHNDYLAAGESLPTWIRQLSE